MTKQERIKQIQDEIQKLQVELYQLNPYAALPTMSNKKFGEEWSEPWILQHVPNLKKENGPGHDMRGINYPLIEVKSSRITFDGAWTQNQLHPTQADAYLFIWYNCNEGTEQLCLISSNDLMQNCSVSQQHGDGCYSMRATINNRKVLSKYMIPSWEKLNEMV